MWNTAKGRRCRRNTMWLQCDLSLTAPFHSWALCKTYLTLSLHVRYAHRHGNEVSSRCACLAHTTLSIWMNNEARIVVVCCHKRILCVKYSEIECISQNRINGPGFFLWRTSAVRLDSLSHRNNWYCDLTTKKVPGYWYEMKLTFPEDESGPASPRLEHFKSFWKWHFWTSALMHAHWIR